MCKIYPSNGPIKTPVSLWGEYFGTVGSDGLVKFSHSSDSTGNATGVIQKDGQADLIQTKVPSGALSGAVKVIKNSEWGNTLNFNIGSCASNSDCLGAQVCCPQNTYKHGQCTNSLSDCSNNIPNSVFEWGFNTGYGNGNSPNPSGDPCSKLSADKTCLANSKCCLDYKATGGIKCVSGKQISNSSNADNDGYCAYYDCSKSDSKICATSTPLKDGRFKTTDVCNSTCQSQAACKTYNKDTCQLDTNCCLNARATGTPCISGAPIISSSNTADNGYCAYYNCKLPDKRFCATSSPSATGTYLGVDGCIAKCAGDLNQKICDCTKTTDCDNTSVLPNQIACGFDSCCDPRPKIISTQPASGADMVCRNAVIKVDFDLRMDTSSFYKNTVLLEALNSGTCPAGTFALGKEKVNKLLANNTLNSWQKLIRNIKIKIARLGIKENNIALADTPNPKQIYCSVPGLVYGQNNGDKTSLIFVPKKILDPATNYYFIVKGDENLDNKTGILSVQEVAFNGPGYQDGNKYIPGSDLKFNSHIYTNSQIIKFLTLSSQGPSAGLCTINKVKINPYSYLFKTNTNALKSLEDDSNALAKTFDTVADSDKVFSAFAYSKNGQILHSVSGYAWNWKFALTNPKALSFKTNISNLPSNEVLINANQGITDDSSQLKATVDMSNFSGSNVSQSGDGFNALADLYVFICNNPWPAVDSSTGIWSPWIDQAQGANIPSYHYKFYYCRDSGGETTLNDLPAIDSNPLIVGASTNNLLCSSDHTSCTNLGKACGAFNSDGSQSGLCVWSVLKESYFLRSPILSPATITSISDQKTGGTVKVNWKSASNQVLAYKIYYLESGKSSLMSKEFKANSVCSTSGNLNTCSKIISGLDNNVPYVFQISVISNDRTESKLSTSFVVTPSDSTPPQSPNNLQAELLKSNMVKFTWATNTDPVAFYRLYHGVNSEKYGEYFNSKPGVTELDIPKDKFPIGDNYFSLVALDDYNNQSIISKNKELYCSMTANASSTDPNVWNKMVCSLQ